ncbi:hypothetical protein Hypma_000667 [Hypsizygus marmoreus]|uniref:Uncharacterized protein n=1 Tax=Hypsizygus marmoreus TaxID=39966 RepID=A0A369JEY1_HYPMA|nr:hypothetical protein Hypma_000667 [Hypsizygus marmoreus]
MMGIALAVTHDFSMEEATPTKEETGSFRLPVVSEGILPVLPSTDGSSTCCAGDAVKVTMEKPKDLLEW